MNSFRIISGPTINQICMRTNVKQLYDRDKIKQITDISHQFVQSIEKKKDKNEIFFLYMKLEYLTKKYTKDYTIK